MENTIKEKSNRIEALTKKIQAINYILYKYL